MPYVKLDAGILDSTLWVEDAVTCKVFITMLAMCKANGMCESTAPGIARRANISLEEARKAIETLESPDPDSRSVEDDGRRVKRVDGGYLVVNYQKYRDKDHTNADRQRRFRGKNKNNSIGGSNSVTPLLVTPPFASASVSVDQKIVTPDGVDPQAWADIFAYRSLPENRRAWGWSGLAQTKMAAVLAKYSPAAQREMVDKAIRNGWRGVWVDQKSASEKVPYLE